MRKADASTALLFCAIMLASTPALAQASRALRMDTGGQPLGTALTDLARRAGRELVLENAAEIFRPAPRLNGRYTFDQALPLLLAGSGLTFKRTADGAYVVYLAPPLPSLEPESPVALPELLVTARSQNSDIPRTQDDIQPYNVWTAHDVGASHAETLDDFLRTRLSSNAQPFAAIQDPANQNGGSRSEINMRGMGAGQTLVLIDGRRVPSLPSIDNIFLQPDINGLPPSAVERIEVLTATSGGVYGAGAVAGAVNIVLKRDYRGGDLAVTYGDTSRLDARTKRVDGRIGFTPDGGRTDVMIALSDFRGADLRTGERDYPARARARRYAGDPATFVAESYALRPADVARIDLQFAPGLVTPWASLWTRESTSSALLSVRRRFGSSVEAYLDGLALRDEGRSYTPRPYIGVPASTLLSSVSSSDDGLEQRSRTTTTRITAGLIVDLPAAWKLNADYTGGQAEVRGLANYHYDPGTFGAYRQSNSLRALSARLAGMVMDLPGGPLTLSILAEDRREHAPIPTVEHYDLFFWVNGMPYGVTQSLRSYYAEARAPLIPRDGGHGLLSGLELQLAARHEVMRAVAPANRDDLLFANDDPVDYRQTAAVYTLGFRVFPIPDVMLRGSVATGVVPPPIDQLARVTMRYLASEGGRGASTALQFGVHSSDSKRRGAWIGSEQPLLITFGGSPTAERARSVSVGLVATPRAAPGLRVSIDYTRIVKSREPVVIQGGSAQYFLDHEDLFPARVIRAPLTDADRAKGYTAGVVTSLDTSAFIIGETISETVDFQFDYRLATRKAGDLRFSSSATWQPLLRRRAELYDEARNAVGSALEPLAWRGVASAEWSRGPWLLGLAADFYARYRVARFGEYAPRADQMTRFQGSDRIPSQVYFDLAGAYRFELSPTAPMHALEARFGIRNILDRDAPVVAQNYYGMGYSPFADPRGRRFELSLISRF